MSVDKGVQTDKVFIIDKSHISHPDYDPRNVEKNQLDLLIITTCKDYYDIYNLLFDDIKKEYVDSKYSSPNNESYKYKLLEMYNFINDPVGKFYYHEDIKSEYKITRFKVPNEVDDKKVIFLYYDEILHKIAFKSNYKLPEIVKIFSVKFMLEIERKIENEEIVAVMEKIE
jgi:hypothetical protein